MFSNPWHEAITALILVLPNRPFDVPIRSSCEPAFDWNRISDELVVVSSDIRDVASTSTIRGLSWSVVRRSTSCLTGSGSQTGDLPRPSSAVATLNEPCLSCADRLLSAASRNHVTPHQEFGQKSGTSRLRVVCGDAAYQLR